MALIKVYLHGQEVAALELESGQEYFAGRGSQCQIPLASERGISRQHLKIWEPAPGVWNVELLSKHGSLVVDGEQSHGFDLVEDTRFSVPPYEFQFLATATLQPFDSNFEAPQEEVNELQFNVESDDGDTPAPGMIENQNGDAEPNFEATQVGRVQLIPFLKVKNTKTSFEEILKLEGNLWVAGRHPDSEILIEDSAISRKHFEIARTNRGYTITDLGSSNGTNVNGQLIPANEPYELHSGDLISVRHLVIHFEIHDGAYQERLADVQHLVPAVSEYSTGSDLSIDYGSAPGNTGHPNNQMVPVGMLGGGQPDGPGAVKVKGPGSKPWADPQFRKKAIWIGAPLILVFAFMFSGGDNTTVPESTDLQSEGMAPPSEEQLAEARDLLKLGKGHYHSGKYEFCLAQIERLHSILPSFEDSRDIENLCRQGLELERINADRERKEKERIEVENKIKAIIANCQSKVNDKITSEEITTCLQPAMELSPEQPEITALISQIKERENLQEIKEEQAEEAARRRSRGKAIFGDAVELENRGQLQRAISKYRQFLNGNYNLDSEESQARRSISNLQSKLTAISNQELAKCKEMIGSEKFKDAILSCDKALDISPSNSDAKASRDIASNKLRRNMKSLYEDSILEESLGNLDAAKEKWNRILQESVPDDDYYKKAKSKLRKYGI